MKIIDADELMEHVWRDKLDSRELIAEMINNAPPVKEISAKIPIDILEQLISQKSKTGRWIKYGAPRCGEQHYQCTSCGYYINFGQWGDLYTKEFKYCPNCGAKMKSEE